MNNANNEWNENYQFNQNKPDFKSSAQYFSEKENADNMLRRLMEHQSERTSEQLKSLNFPRGATVLDIGSGPGTLAVPLTKYGCKVTVVEPSDAMADAMEIYKKFCGVDEDIARIQKLWQEVEVNDVAGKYDYVISSFALGVPNLLDALMKMNAAAKKQVHIFWFLNVPPGGSVRRDLWRILYKDEHPDWFSYAHVVWLALYQENIYANLTVHSLKDQMHFSNIQDAVTYYANMISVSNEPQLKMIEDYLKEHLVLQSDNTYIYQNDGKYAHIWWDK